MTDCAAPRHGDPEPAAPHAWLCYGCTSGLRRDLRRLPALHAALGELLDPRGSGGSGGSGDGLPFHEPAAECRSQIRHDLAWWAAETAANGRSGPPGATIPALAGWLSGQLSWTVYRPWAGDMAGAFAADRSRAIALLDPYPVATIAIPGRCPQCGASRALNAVVYTGPGDQRPSLVTCSGCGHDWDATQWLKLGRDIIRTMEAA